MIYLDYQATTPLAPEAKEAMLRWLDGPEGDGYGNPHSAHRLGRLAGAAVDIAREQVAALAGAPHVIPVDAEGLVDPQAEWPQGTGLVAVMQVNNEIGTVQPIAELYRRTRAIGALLVCDAVQAAGKMPIAEADMIAISAHKFHGPKGIGALWVRDGIELAPYLSGGGQEHGLRSGTLSPALCAGFGAAAKLALERMEEDQAHVAALFDRARDLFSGWRLNGSAVQRYKGNLNIRRPGVDVPRLMSDVRDICFSAGSACASESRMPSRILSAIGLSPAEARGSIRLGFGRYTTMAELEEAAERIDAAAALQE